MNKVLLGFVAGVVVGVVAVFVLTRPVNQPEADTNTVLPETNMQATNQAPTNQMPPLKMEPQTPPAQTEAQKMQLAAGEADHAPASITFDVTGGMFYYVPNVIHVKKGDTVTINFLNAGGFHDFTLDEFAVKIGPFMSDAAAPAAVMSATFVADQAGTFKFYCNVGSHRAMGQEGTLIVEE